LLENVPTMASVGGEKAERNVFAQLLCAFVGIGYQVQQFCIDAWSCGSPQSRSRLFVCITAPGFELPSRPRNTHSHPSSVKQRSLGKASNSLPFGNRVFESTPFEYVTIKQSTAD